MQNNFFFLSKSGYENNYIAIDQNKINSILANIDNYTFCLRPFPLPLSTPATQAKLTVVSGRKDRVDLVLIYCYVVIFVARFG